MVHLLQIRRSSPHGSAATDGFASCRRAQDTSSIRTRMAERTRRFTPARRAPHPWRALEPRSSSQDAAPIRKTQGSLRFTLA